MPHQFVFASALLTLLFTSSLCAEEVRQQPGAVEQHGGDVPQNVKLPPLDLTDAQREQVRKAVLTEHSDIQFQLAATKSAKDFEPKVGETLPSGLVPNGFPSSVV